MSTDSLVSWSSSTCRGNYGFGSSWPLYRGCTYSLLRYYTPVVYLSHASQQSKSQGTFYFRTLKIFYSTTKIIYLKIDNIISNINYNYI